jgi:hypothetical protein
MKPKTESKKVISLLDCLTYLSVLEAHKLGTKYIPGCPTYANGTRALLKRLWEKIIKDQWGSQQFTNDSFYRWIPNWENPSEDERKFLAEFKGEENSDEEDHEEYDYFLFDVSW